MSDFNIKKFLSARRVLELFMAFIILVVPTLWGSLSQRGGLYVLLALSCAVLIYHVIDTKSLCFGPFSIILLVLTAYSLIAMLWAVNTGEQIFFVMFSLFALIFSLVCGDYFKCDELSNIKRRLTMLIFISGTILAIYNVICFVFDGFKLAEGRFCAGLGNENYLGLFMFGAIWCGVLLLADIKGTGRIFAAAAIVLMAIVLIFARSSVAYMFFAVFAMNYISVNRKKINRVVMVLLEIAFSGFAIGAMIAIVQQIIHAAPIFWDGIAAGFVHPLGSGAGFLSRASMVGSSGGTSLALGANIISACGLVGVIIVLVMLLWTLSLAILKSSGAATLMVFCVIYAIFSDPTRNAAVLAMFVALVVYCEVRGGAARKRKVPHAGAVLVAALFVLIISLYLAIAEGAYTRAVRAHERGDLTAAEKSSQTALSLLGFDSRYSFEMAKIYADLYDETGLSEYPLRSLHNLSNARKHDKQNAAYTRLEARMYSVSYDSDNALAKWRQAIEETPSDTSNYVNLAYELLNKIKRTADSAKVRELYDELSELAEKCEDSDAKKQINDALDSAKSYLVSDAPIVIGDAQ